MVVRVRGEDFWARMPGEGKDVRDFAGKIDLRLLIRGLRMTCLLWLPGHAARLLNMKTRAVDFSGKICNYLSAPNRSKVVQELHSEKLGC